MQYNAIQYNSSAINSILFFNETYTFSVFVDIVRKVMKNPPTVKVHKYYELDVVKVLQ